MGGFFERLIEVMKFALSKAIEKASLTFSELEEILLDVECFMNNRPLVYLGEEFEDRTITPNILLSSEPAKFLEDNTEVLEEETKMTRRLRYLKQCREHLRKRYVNKYLHALGCEFLDLGEKNIYCCCCLEFWFLLYFNSFWCLGLRGRDSRHDPLTSQLLHHLL